LLKAKAGGETSAQNVEDTDFAASKEGPWDYPPKVGRSARSLADKERVNTGGKSRHGFRKRN